MSSQIESFPLELGTRPELDVNVAAERMLVVPVESGGVPRIEIEGRRGQGAPVIIRRDGERVIVTSSERGEDWPWPHGGMVKRVTLVVPAHVRARIRQDFGRMVVEHLAGCDLDLSASAGTIDLEDVRGRLKIVVDSGTVAGTGLAGTFDVVSSAGSVKLSIDALDAGEHHIRTAMGSVKVLLSPSIAVKLETSTTLGSARVSHPSTPNAEAVMRLSAELGSIKVKTGNEGDELRHGDWPDWRRLWRDVASRALAVAREEVLITPPPAPTPVPEAELRKVLELVESGKLTAPDAERLIRAMGR